MDDDKPKPDPADADNAKWRTLVKPIVMEMDRRGIKMVRIDKVGGLVTLTTQEIAP